MARPKRGATNAASSQTNKKKAKATTTATSRKQKASAAGSLGPSALDPAPPLPAGLKNQVRALFTFYGSWVVMRAANELFGEGQVSGYPPQQTHAAPPVPPVVTSPAPRDNATALLAWRPTHEDLLQMMLEDGPVATVPELETDADDSIPAVNFRTVVTKMIHDLNEGGYKSTKHKDWKPATLVGVGEDQHTALCLAVWSYVTNKMDEICIPVKTKNKFKEILMRIFVHKKFAIDQKSIDDVQPNNVCFGNPRYYPVFTYEKFKEANEHLIQCGVKKDERLRLFEEHWKPETKKRAAELVRFTDKQTGKGNTPLGNIFKKLSDGAGAGKAWYQHDATKEEKDQDWHAKIKGKNKQVIWIGNLVCIMCLYPAYYRFNYDDILNPKSGAYKK